jgi:predicted transcriptional regulator
MDAATTTTAASPVYSGGGSPCLRSSSTLPSPSSPTSCPGSSGWPSSIPATASSSSRRTRARNPDGGFGYGACSPSTEELAFVPSPSGSPPPGHLLERRRRLVDGERRAFTFLMFDPAVSSHFRLVQLWQGAAMMEGVEEAAEVEGMHIYTSETGAWSDRYGTPSNVDKSNRTIRW